jgi:predicted nucleic acid-binding protein
VQRAGRGEDVPTAVRVTDLKGGGALVLVPCGEQVFTAAEEIVQLAFRRAGPVMVRSLDAIHVASAVTAQARVMVATDTRLRQVAAMAKLKLAP